MNVLVAMPLGEFGGGAEQMLATYLKSTRDAQDVCLHFLFFAQGQLVDEARKHGYPVRVLNAGRLRQLARWLQVQWRIGRVLDEWAIDTVLAWMPKAAIYVGGPARTRGLPLLMWRHDIPSSLGFVDRLTLRLGAVRSVACSSNAAERAFRLAVSGIPSRSIYPAVEPRKVNAENASVIREILVSGNNGPVVGTIARLQPWKRIDLFLKAASLLRSSYPNLQVVVVGGESHGLSAGYGEELIRLGRSCLGDAVHFVGEQWNTGDWLEAMDLFVLASEAEPFGIALVEALCAGKPVVACAGGGPDEIITQDVIGCLLSAKPTPLQMSEAMATLLGPTALEKARLSNSEHATRFSSRVMAEQINGWLRAEFYRKEVMRANIKPTL